MILLCLCKSLELKACPKFLVLIKSYLGLLQPYWDMISLNIVGDMKYLGGRLKCAMCDSLH